VTIIRVKDGFRYRITDEDYLWLGRSLDGEGPNVAGYTWAYLQKFAGIRSVRERYGTLTAFIRSYSQPINPIWMRGGSRCPVAVPGTDCDERLLRRREEKISLHPDQFPLEVKAALAALRAGILPNPVGRATDFATCERVDRDIRENAPRAEGWQITSRAGGCFVSTERSRAWPDDYVTIAPSSAIMNPAAWGIGLGTVLLVGAGGFAAWAWWRGRRRGRMRA
jgi:hypothetical protein